MLAALRYTNLCQILADQLAAMLRDTYSGIVDWVVGSDHAGATISFAVAAHLNAQHDFTEKGVGGLPQHWSRFEIGSDESVLQVEELITTLGTLNAVRDSIRTGTPHDVRFVPAVLTLVNRSGQDMFDGSPIISLVDYNIETWQPAECPLCAAGSKKLRPKQHWGELTAPCTEDST